MILNKLKTAILGCMISIFLVSCSSNSKWTSFPENIRVAELDGGTDIYMVPSTARRIRMVNRGKPLNFLCAKPQTMEKDSLELSVWIDRGHFLLKF